MIPAVVENATEWPEMIGRLNAEQSMLLLIPRYYGTGRISTTVKAVSKDHYKIVDLDTRTAQEFSDGPYQYIWNVTKKSLKKRKRMVSHSKVELVRLLKESCRKANRPVMFLLRGGSIETATLHLDFLMLFHSLVNTMDLQHRIMVVAFDDYATINLGQNILRGSFHESLIQIRWNRLTIETARAALSQMIGERIQSAIPDEILECIICESDCHPGIIHTIGDFISLYEGDLSHKVVQAKMAEIHFIQEIEKSVLHGWADLKTASQIYDHETGAAEDLGDKWTQKLKQLGLLYYITSGKLKLDQGYLRKRFENVINRQAQEKARKKKKRGRKLKVETRSASQNRNIVNDNDIVVIHLSDLHVSFDKYNYSLGIQSHNVKKEMPSLEKLIKNDLQSIGLHQRIDCLVVTGDIVHAGRRAQFKSAKNVLSKIQKVLGIHNDQTLLVPGNHDVKWDPDPLELTNPFSSASRGDYEDFVKNFDKEPTGMVDFIRVTSPDRKRELQIIGLDSNYLEDVNNAGIGWVSTDALSQAERKRTKATVTEGVERSIWLAVHHHVYPVESTTFHDASQKRVSLLANSADILNYSAEIGASAILHGHQHQPCVTESRRWPTDRDHNSIAVIGAGSIGSIRDDLGQIGHNHYFILVSRPNTIAIYSRRSGDTSYNFVSHGYLVIKTK